MLLQPSEDQEFLRDTTARFLADKMPASVVRSLRDHDAGFTDDYWRTGVELGWTHLLVPESAGGGSVSGAGIVDLSLIAYELGRRAAPGPLLPNAVVAGALGAAGGHATGGEAGGGHEEVLAGLLSGERRAAWAHFEDAHLDAAGPPLLHMRVEGDEIVLDGTKRPVESAERSDVLLASGPTTGGMTQVLVPAGAAGLRITPMTSVDLTRRFSVVCFDEVRLPLDAVVGELHGAADALALQELHALVVANAESVGAMQTAFEMTLEWTFDRYSFGRPLASYQAIKHRMATMKTCLEASHAISDESAAAVAAGDPRAAKLTSAATAYIGQYGAELMQECVQLHGGIGVTFEHDLHLYLRRHTLNRALHGTPAEHRRRVAAELDSEMGAS